VLVLLDPAARPVIGHRGAAAHAPENTIVSFERAVADGADAIEFDVHVSADGHAVVIHDPTLERTTDGTGAVAALTLERIRAADAGARFTRGGAAFPYRGQGVRVPSLSEVLDRFPALPMLIEIKTPAASQAVRVTLERHGAAPRCVVGSFDHAALAPFREAPWHASASQRDMQRMIAHVLLAFSLGAARYEALAIPTHWRGLPLPIGRIARAASGGGRPVHVWVVDDPREARALRDAGVAGIITNDPAAILSGASPA
jgi:glycerophosphoryl diester phosphodiesterase